LQVLGVDESMKLGLILKKYAKGVDRIHLAQWRALVNTVMNFRVHNAG